MIQSIRNLRKVYDAFEAKNSVAAERHINDHFAVFLQTIATHILGGWGLN